MPRLCDVSLQLALESNGTVSLRALFEGDKDVEGLSDLSNIYWQDKNNCGSKNLRNTMAAALSLPGCYIQAQEKEF